MPQPPGYPKPIFVVMQCYLVMEGEQEVLIHDHDTVLAMTRSTTAAEIILSKMKDRTDCTVRSNIQPTPAALLELLAPEPEMPESLNSLLEIADASVQDQG